MTEIYLIHLGSGKYGILTFDKSIFKLLFTSYDKYSVKIWMSLNGLTYDKLTRRNKPYKDHYIYYSFKLKSKRKNG